MAKINWQAAPTEAEVLAAAKAEKRNEIDLQREAAISAGFEYDFNGTADTVQMREQDRANITGLVIAAQMRLAQGDETTTKFRAGSDETYTLTPQEVVDLGIAAQQHVSAKYEIAWGLKDKVERYTTVQTVNGISWPTE